jgi:hypothetical protein
VSTEGGALVDDISFTVGRYRTRLVAQGPAIARRRPRRLGQIQVRSPAQRSVSIVL